MNTSISRRTALAGALSLAGATGVTPRSWAADPIKIGFSIPQTGPLAANGLAVLLSAQIWEADVNAKGGLGGRPVQLVFYDDQSNPSNVPRIYTKLLDIDKVDLVVTNGTNLTVPAMPIIMERGKVAMVMFSLAINEKFHYDRFFQTMPYGPDGKASISEGFFEVGMAMTPKPQTVALVGADAEFAKAAVTGARTQAKQRGLKVVYDRTYPPNTVDFGPVIRGIAASEPDIVYVGSYPLDTSGFIRAAHELNFRPKLLGGGMVGTQSTSLKADLGEMLNGVVSYDLYIPAAAKFFPEVAPFLQRYQARAGAAGTDPLGYYTPPFAYATFEIYAQAVAAVGLDDEKLAKYIHATTFKTIVGDIAFGADGEWTRPRMLTVQFRGVKGHDVNQFTRPETEVILHPAQYQTSTLQYPFGS
jgi:branched-chain amino acid transport system substrate-binding protein